VAWEATEFIYSVWTESVKVWSQCGLCWSSWMLGNPLMSKTWKCRLSDDSCPWEKMSCYCEVAKMCISLGLVFWKTAWTCVGLLPNSWSVPAHSALSVCELLAKYMMTVVPHPPFWVEFVPKYCTVFSYLSNVIREWDQIMLSWFTQNHRMHLLDFKPYLPMW
jgi:hypothetical protein